MIVITSEVWEPTVARGNGTVACDVRLERKLACGLRLALT